MTNERRQSREVDGKGRTVRELLGGRKYSIDYYQREYKWQSKQVAELIDDLSGKFQESHEGGNERSAAQPTPICRCGSSPDSHDTTTATSLASPSVPARRSRSAMRAILASRADVAATSADASATA